MSATIEIKLTGNVGQTPSPTPPPPSGFGAPPPPMHGSNAGVPTRSGLGGPATPGPVRAAGSFQDYLARVQAKADANRVKEFSDALKAQQYVERSRPAAMERQEREAMKNLEEGLTKYREKQRREQERAEAEKNRKGIEDYLASDTRLARQEAQARKDLEKGLREYRELKRDPKEKKAEADAAQQEEAFREGRAGRLGAAMQDFQQRWTALTNKLLENFGKFLPAVATAAAGLQVFRTAIGVVQQDIQLRHLADVQSITGQQLEAEYTRSTRGYKAAAGVARVVPLVGDLVGGIIEGVGDLFTSGQKRFIERNQAFQQVIDRNARFSPELAAERAASRSNQVALNVSEAQAIGPKLAELERAKRELDTVNYLKTIAENSQKLDGQIAETRAKAEESLAALKAQIKFMELLGVKIDKQTKELIAQLEKNRDIKATDPFERIRNGPGPTPGIDRAAGERGRSLGDSSRAALNFPVLAGDD